MSILSIGNADPPQKNQRNRDEQGAEGLVDEVSKGGKPLLEFNEG